MNSTQLNEHDANQGAQSSGEFLGMTGNSGWYLLGSGGATIMMVTRIEARTANPALAPSVALGANFRLDGTSNLNANSVVAYLVIPACPARDAYELAVTMNGAQLAPVEGAACDTGVVAFAAPANGVTDVYVYITAI